MKKLFLLFVVCFSLTTFAQKVSYGHRLLNEDEKAFYQHRKDSMVNLLVDATLSIVDPTITYDPSYVKIDYPMGDVPANTGVCTDVVIRAFRKGLNRDLQQEIYEFRKWQRDEREHEIIIDRNIDHRRVRNLMEYFEEIIGATDGTFYSDYFGRDLTKCEKGDIIVFDLGGGQLHIAICVSETEMVHNMCCGQVIDNIADYAKSYKIIRNFRFWDPPKFIHCFDEEE